MLEAGADPKATLADGDTPLMLEDRYAAAQSAGGGDHFDKVKIKGVRVT
ncbi:MAG: hypothetical protein RQ899_08285 [Pseudomonadales bacterium]|nr:hypothetical protein [Pseudomonadales bacterium]